MFHWPSIFVYTDLFESYRVVDTVEGGITKHERRPILKDIPCRIYSNPTPSINMTEQASTSDASNQLCCDLGVDIRAGDEIIVHRNGRTHDVPVSSYRYFAGRPNEYRLPFGGVSNCDIEHIQVALLNEERVD